MPKTDTNEKLSKHTLFLRSGDMEYIQSAVPKGKASYAIRQVISNFVDRLKAKETNIDEVSPNE